MLVNRKKWRIKFNEKKSTNVTLTDRKYNYALVAINQERIPRANESKKISVNLDAKWKWKQVKKTIEEKTRVTGTHVASRTPLSAVNS